jgi:hypothetical protein
MDDIDAFTKAQEIPTEDEIRARAEEIQRTHLTLDVEAIATGKRLADLVEGLTAIAPDVPGDIPKDTAGVIAGLLDYVSEYLDCTDLYSFTDKLEVPVMATPNRNARLTTRLRILCSLPSTCPAMPPTEVAPACARAIVGAHSTSATATNAMDRSTAEIVRLNIVASSPCPLYRGW